ncbi:EAL domain-containing protein [Noviherbaspirillum denitrificans]|uniref:Diguanylate cyclase n=1 Tax=Noviherbaspirillum denitrificans TaxID=1968433 RepID=A0A254TDK0_9BURK|nr:EAL domain-containing protein [Noviherbaspirillum denitrificans]OWW20625.1 hypothetical protein AYR66_15165 [Noviherbaspirillum denitrificans]
MLTTFPDDTDQDKDDLKRLEVLSALQILDSGDEPDFDRLTHFAQAVARTPMAGISLIDRDRLWFKSAIGLDIREVDRVIAFCNQAIKQDHPYVVTDARAHPLFRDNPLVTGPPHFRFYGGFPLITSSGYRIGALAVLDTKPRRLSRMRMEVLEMLAEQVMTLIELRRQRQEISFMLAEREAVNRMLSEQSEHLREAQRIGRIGSWELEPDSKILRLSEETFRIFGVNDVADAVPFSAFMGSVHRDDRAALSLALEAAMNGVAQMDLVHRIVLPGGVVRHVHERGELRLRHGRERMVAGTVQDVSDQVAAEARIRELAYFDTLTGLPNRRFILDRLDKMVSMRHRMPYDGAVIFIDLDNFKVLNDTHGHDKGDLLLKEVARRIQSCVRHYDSVGRFGGDEFVVLVERIGDDAVDEGAHALHVAQKILTVLNEGFDLDGLEHRSTPSIGIALLDGEAVSTGELLKRADMAMYKSKAEGRNTIRFYSDELQKAVTERALLEKEIRVAVEQKEFFLDFQLQENGAGNVSGIEVLLRWRHASRGIVTPAEFIALAEELGLIMQIGSWVLEEACKLIKRWSTLPGLQELGVSVNVSVKQFHHPDFVAQVTGALQKTGADPKRLNLEITESMLISDYHDTRTKMITLKALGIRFALDDFGTGCSSLSHLQRLPIDQLKIDQSFVQHVNSDKNDATITRSIISLARSFGLAVIAEGVETEEQRRFLADEGCEDFQGFLYHPTLGVSDVESYLARRS